MFNISTSEILFFSFSSVLGDLRVQFKTFISWVRNVHEKELLENEVSTGTYCGFSINAGGYKYQPQTCRVRPLFLINKEES